jgi:hypothetical protein
MRCTILVIRIGGRDSASAMLTSLAAAGASPWSRTRISRNSTSSVKNRDRWSQRQCCSTYWSCSLWLLASGLAPCGFSQNTRRRTDPKAPRSLLMVGQQLTILGGHVWKSASRRCWAAGNRWQFAISGVDVAGRARPGVWSSRRAMLAGWRTVLWYHGRSRVVPWYCQGYKGVPGAVLSIANAYTSRPQLNAEGSPPTALRLRRTGRQKADPPLLRFGAASGHRFWARSKPPKATSMRPQSHPKAC